ERRDRRAGTRNDAAKHAHERRATEASSNVPGLAQAGDSRLDRAARYQCGRRKALLEPYEHLAQSVRTDHHRKVADSIAKDFSAERQPLDAVDVVDPDGRDQHAEEQADERVRERAAAESDDAREAEQHD